MAVAHELGHLVLHTQHFDADAETQANQFADEFLLPAHLITHDLQNLSLGKLGDLKVKWGVPMQTSIERGRNLGTVTTAQRSALYRQHNARSWKTQEPHRERLVPDEPTLAASIGARMRAAGLSESEIATLIGVADGCATPFNPSAHQPRLKAVVSG